MLDVIGASLIGLFMEIIGKQPPKPEPVTLLAWHQAPIFVLPAEPDPGAQKLVGNYLAGISGLSAHHQGVWLQSDLAQLAEHQGTVPVTAASLTKIATSLAALERWGVQHRFTTEFYATGEIKNGVVQGDLIVQGGGDPFFVWEEAFAVGNALNQLGIRQVTGNLVVVGNFYMNYNANSNAAGVLLKQGLDSRNWSAAATSQYNVLPPGTPRPQLAIRGNVIWKQDFTGSAQLLLRRQSMTLAEILKQMNIYSNNKMSEIVATEVGGASMVAQIAAQAAQVPTAEIQLVNGSGLSLANRISPRATCAMLLAIERRLLDEPFGVADLFPMAGRDRTGTMLNRRIPEKTAVKTGTLAQVSALAGVLPTRDRGLVWFAIINHGSSVEEFRRQQDKFLQSLVRQWGTAPTVVKTAAQTEWLGDPARNVR